jgi:hypothetical protein
MRLLIVLDLLEGFETGGGANRQLASEFFRPLFASQLAPAYF